jgi:hypothetical protein
MRSRWRLPEIVPAALRVRLPLTRREASDLDQPGMRQTVTSLLRVLGSRSTASGT